MNRPLTIALALAVVTSRVGTAQGNPISAGLKSDYVTIRDFFIRAAEEMPEADYAFKPSPDVRSFWQQVAHVARDQYSACGKVRGESKHSDAPSEYSLIWTKTKLVAALKTAFAYCDGAYDSLTDASAMAVAPNFGISRNGNKFGVLNANVWHTWEHYGNIVVYLRMKGLVPPSSQ